MKFYCDTSAINDSVWLTGAPTDTGTRTAILLYGCQVPRLLHHHHGVLTCTNCCRLCGLFNGSLSTYRGEGAAHGGMLVSEKID